MEFKGDLIKFNQTDLFNFISQLDNEGILTIFSEDDLVTISFKDGYVVDAHSDLNEKKLLLILYYKKIIDKKQYFTLKKAIAETGMPVKQCMQKIDIPNTNLIEKIFQDVIEEVLLQFVLLERGSFQFKEIEIEGGIKKNEFTCREVIHRINYKADEWRNTLHSIGSLHSILNSVPGNIDFPNINIVDKTVIQFANREKKQSIWQVISSVPFPRYHVLMSIKKCIAAECVTIQKVDYEYHIDDSASENDSLFFEFKRYYKKILLEEKTKDKVREIVKFCKDKFDLILLISLEYDILVECKVYPFDSDYKIDHEKITDVKRHIKNDPVFSWIVKTKHSFFGKPFQSFMLNGIIELPETGECAILPININQKSINLLYVHSLKETEGLNPFNYLTILLWLIIPPKDDISSYYSPEKNVSEEYNQNIKTKIKSTDVSNEKAKILVDAIDDLPPMPQKTAKILQLLSNPDVSTNELADAIASDIALTARILKISNSALYGSVQEVKTIKIAITRLGRNIIRSIVLISMVKSYFPTDNINLRGLAQKLWQHSKECGLASRRIASVFNYSDLEEAFIGGVLHDIGKLVILLKLPEEYKAIWRKQTIEKISILEAENEVLSFNHTQLGELLLKKWNMPEGLQVCCKYHHSPQNYTQLSSLPFIVSYGDYLSNLFSSRMDESILNKSIDIKTIMKTIYLSENEVESLHQTIVEDLKKSDIFD